MPLRTPACLLLLVVAAACGRPRVEEPLRTTVALPNDCRELRIEVPKGSLKIVGGGTGEVEVDAITRRIATDDESLAKLRAIEFTLSLAPDGAPGVYRLTAPGVPADLDPNESAMIFSALLTIPSDIAVRARTERGDLLVFDRNADVTLETGAGDLTFDDVQGAARGRTGRGNCTVVGQRGDLEVSTGEGAILAFIEALGAGGVRLSTTGPRLTCQLPEGGFDLEARVEHSPEGKVAVRNAFEVPVAPEGTGHVAQGPVHGGGPTVDLDVARGWLDVVPLETGN